MGGYSTSQSMNVKFKKFCKKKLEHPDHYETIHLEDCVTPVTILIGPNGTGKSMSLRHIEEECKKANIDFIRYSNKANDIVNTSMDFEPWKIACAFHSEGERICDSINNWANSEMLQNLLTHERDLYVLIDELDSGLSADRLFGTIMDYLTIIHMEKCKHPNRNISFIFTCNTWEMLECFQHNNKVTAYWIPTRQKIDFSKMKYPDFRNMYYDYYKYMKDHRKEDCDEETKEKDETQS